MKIDPKTLQTVDQFNKGLQAFREGKGIPAEQFFAELLTELERLDKKLTNRTENGGASTAISF